jgi:hypothetical protein
MWNLERINTYIENKIEENLNLEYKSSGALGTQNDKTSEISKDVSSFANSDGGYIIYGIAEDKIQKHLPSHIDPVSRTAFSKEWLEQIIHSKIRPRIEGIKVYPVEYDSDTLIYVIEIPKSDTAHQAEDKRYYKRFNFKSEAMYDYEVRDILNRPKHPKIDLEFKIVMKRNQIPTKNANFNESFYRPVEPEFKNTYKLEIFFRNNGKVLANYINCHLYLLERCIYPNNYNQNTKEIKRLFADNTTRDIVDTEYIPSIDGNRKINKYGPSRYEPLLPTLSLKTDTIELNEDSFIGDDKIGWTIHVDNAEPRKGSMFIRDIQIKKE